MDSWLQDQLLDSWEQAYEEGDNPGCIMGFNTFFNQMQIPSTIQSIPKSKKHTKKHKRKSKSNKELLNEKIEKELGSSKKMIIMSTPYSRDSMLKAYEDMDNKSKNDDWFIEWLGVEPQKDEEDTWFLEWLNIKT